MSDFESQAVHHDNLFNRTTVTGNVSVGVHAQGLDMVLAALRSLVSVRYSTLASLAL